MSRRSKVAKDKAPVPIPEGVNRQQRRAIEQGKATVTELPNRGQATDDEGPPPIGMIDRNLNTWQAISPDEHIKELSAALYKSERNGQEAVKKAVELFTYLEEQVWPRLNWF